MAQATADIKNDIEQLKTRIADSADEIDSRLLRLPRAAKFALRYRRHLLAFNVVLAIALWVFSMQQRSSSPPEKHFKVTFTELD